MFEKVFTIFLKGPVSLFLMVHRLNTFVNTVKYGIWNRSDCIKDTERVWSARQEGLSKDLRESFHEKFSRIVLEVIK